MRVDDEDALSVSLSAIAGLLNFNSSLSGLTADASLLFEAARIRNGTEHDHHAGYGEDQSNWAVFIFSFGFLILIDFVLFNKDGRVMTFRMAIIHTIFMMLCAAAFCIYIYNSLGNDAAIGFGTGYLLEWMLSVDNLFVFHRVMTLFAMPPEQKHTALFWGIIGALCLRFLMLGFAQELMKSFEWTKYIFGAFLIWTGFKAMGGDEDDDDEIDSPLFAWLKNNIPYIDVYHPDGAYFFIEVAEGPAGSPPVTKGTRLLLVVICLELTDLIFAIDSVSALVSEVPDLYISFTGCMFATAGLRALYFVIDGLVDLFSLLAYGVAVIIIVIGAKTMLSDYVELPRALVLTFLVTTLALSILLSVMIDKPRDEEKEPPRRRRSFPSSLHSIPGSRSSSVARLPVDRAPVALADIGNTK